jgi:hypothetical protein
VLRVLNFPKFNELSLHTNLRSGISHIEHNQIHAIDLIDAFYATPAKGGFVFYREEFPPALSLIEQWKPMDHFDRPLIKLP